MGASAQKKKRQELKNAGVDPKAKNLTEQEVKAKKFKKAAIIVVAVFVVFAIFVGIFSSNLLYNQVTAVKVNDMSFTAADYSYYHNVIYNNYFNSYYQYYGQFASYFIPDDEALKPEVLAYMKELAMLYEKAQDAGYTLDAQQLQDIEDAIADAEEMAATYEYPNLNSYLGALYGKGMNEEIFRKNMAIATIASGYASSIRYGFEVTEDDKAAYYDTHKDDMDTLTFRYLFISGAAVPADETKGTPAISAEEAMAAAKGIAEQMQAEVKNESQFMMLANELTGSETTRYVSFGADIASTTSEGCAKWLLEGDHEEGDIGVVEEEAGYYVLYFLNRHDNDYETVNVRHILIQVGEDMDDAAAKAKAEEVLKEWQDGDATEDSFAALADKYSDDTAVGGLYEGVYKNQMVAEFDAWCFAGNRHAGDVEIVKTADYGYHIIYYVGASHNYKEHLSEEGCRDDLYLEWVSAFQDNYNVTSNWVLSYAR